MTSRAAPFFDELAADHLTRPGVVRRAMFGRDALTVDRAVYAFRHGDLLALALPAEAAAALLADGQAHEPTMGERVMRGWVALPLDDDPDRWWRLLDEAHDHKRSTGPAPRRRRAR